MFNKIILPRFKGDDKDFANIDFSKFETDFKFKNAMKYKMWLNDKMSEQKIGVGVRDKVLKILEEIGILKFSFEEVCTFPDIRSLCGIQPIQPSEKFIAKWSTAYHNKSE